MPRPTQAQILIALAGDANLFHDEQYEPYAAVPVGEHTETHRLRERGFRRWLVKRMYEMTGGVPNAEALSQALNLLEAQAVFDGSRYELGLRVVRRGPIFLYDLADAGWRVAEVDHHGWRITADPFVFRRGANTGPQVEPVRDGDLAEVLDFVNLRTEDDRTLFLVYLVTCLVPEIPHPVLMVSAEKGAGKSTLTRVVRRLVDPADEELLSLPSEPNELALLLSRNYVPVFDNLDGLQSWQSDYLSRAATGGGITKRRLYTDEEEVILKFRRCVVLNGINPAATKPDLLDRILHLTLERISPQERREEREFWAAFEQARPRIFGAMLTALSKAMHLYDQVLLREKPRRADFATWGCAAAEAMGVGGKTFLDAYWRSIGRQNEVAIESHPVASAVVALLEDRGGWEGTPAELLAALEGVAEREKIDTKAKTWPKAAHVLTRRLREVKSNLIEVGITWEESRDERHRWIALRKIGEESVSSVMASEHQVSPGIPADTTPDAPDATHDASVASSVSPNSRQSQGADAPDALFPYSSGAASGDGDRPGIPPWKKAAVQPEE